MRSEQHAHGQGVVPEGSLASRMQSAKDSCESAQSQLVQEQREDGGKMGRGAVGGKAVATTPEDKEERACPPPTTTKE